MLISSARILEIIWSRTSNVEDVVVAEDAVVAAVAADVVVITTTKIATTRMETVSSLVTRTRITSRDRRLPLRSQRAAIHSVVKRKKKRPLSSKDKEEVEISRPAKIRVKINSPKTQGPKLRSKLRPRNRRSPRRQHLSKTVAGVQLCLWLSRTRVKLRIVPHNRLHSHQSLREVIMLGVVLEVAPHEVDVVEVALDASPEAREVVDKSRFVLTTSG